MPNSVGDTIQALEAIDDNGAKLSGVLKVWAADNTAIREIDANPHFNRAPVPTRALILINLALEGGALINPMRMYGAPTRDAIKSKMKDVMAPWAKLVAIPHVSVPSRHPTAPRYGVGEQIFVKVPAAVPRWALGNVKLIVAPRGCGCIPLGSGRYIFTAPDTWPDPAREVTVGYRLAKGPIKSPELAQLKFTIVRPQTCVLRHVKDIHYTGSTPAPDGRGGPWNPDPNGGFLARHLIGPADVSFARIDLHEKGNGNVWTATGGRPATTRILGATGTRLLGQTHGTPDGVRLGVTDMERWFNAGPPPQLTADILVPQPVPSVTAAGTCIGADSVYSPILGVSTEFGNDLSAAGAATVVAEAGIDIELHYRVHKVAADSETPNQRIGTNKHEISLTACGTLTVLKGGVSKTFRRDHVNVP